MREKAYMGRSAPCRLFRIGLFSRVLRKSGYGRAGEHSTSNTTPKDKRSIIRYSITGIVQFEWQAVDNQWYDGIGITLDIGKGGVFIESDSIPPVGSPLKLTLTLTSESTPNLNSQTYWLLALFATYDQEPSQLRGFGTSAVFHVDAPQSSAKRDGKR